MQSNYGSSTASEASGWQADDREWWCEDAANLQPGGQFFESVLGWSPSNLVKDLEVGSYKTELLTTFGLEPCVIYVHINNTINMN